MNKKEYLSIWVAGALSISLLTVPGEARDNDCEGDVVSSRAQTVTLSHDEQAALTGPAVLQPSSKAGEQITWRVISGGGSTRVSTAYVLSGTIGQSAVSAGTTADFRLSSGFWPPFSGAAACCIGRVGDVNGSGGDEPTIGDVSVLIDARFISGTCDGMIDCLGEADVNQSGGLDPTCDDISIGDISVLIDYLFITGSSLGLPGCL